MTGPQFPPQAYLPPPPDAGPPSEAAYGSVPPPSDPFWTQAPTPPQTPYAYADRRPRVRRPISGFSIAGITLGCLAVLILPLLIGPLAIIMAGVGKAKGERHSTVALIVAIAGTIAGVISRLVT